MATFQVARLHVEYSVALRLGSVFDGKGHSFGLRSFIFFASRLSLRKLGQHLYKKDKRLQPWLMALTVWGGMIPFFILFSAAGAWGVFADRLQAFEKICKAVKLSMFLIVCFFVSPKI